MVKHLSYKGIVVEYIEDVSGVWVIWNTKEDDNLVYLKQLARLFTKSHGFADLTFEEFVNKISLTDGI